jgi:hypothetical protein
MFNDWQITHLHLGQNFKSTAMVDRSGPLLFAHITGEIATLIDVRGHRNWTEIAILETLLKANPTALPYEAKGVIDAPQLTSRERAFLRRRGGNAFVKVAGRFFIPGLGISASGHATRLVQYLNHFRRGVERLKAELRAQRGPGVIRLGAIFCDGALMVIDKNRPDRVLYAMRPVE